MGSFVDSYLSHTRDYESPSSFWKWSAYASIAAVLRDNCWKKEGTGKLYPNCYILFLAESGHHRKGRPVSLCEQLVTKVNNTKIISGRASIQAIIEELSYAETDPKTGRVIQGGSAVFFAPELSAGIVADPQAVDILTDIYEFKESYKSTLKTRGKTKIDHMVFNMLAASNMDLVISTFDKKATHGGLLARTFLITPDEFRPSNSLWRSHSEEKERELKNSLNLALNELVAISQLRGEFKPTDRAIDAFEDWYTPLREGQKGKSDKSGVFGRIHTGVTKLAMILAAARHSMIIEREDVERAIVECMALVPNYNKLVLSSGKSSESEVGAIVLQDIFTSIDYTMQRKDLLARHWTSFSAEVLDKFIATAVQAQLISEQISGSSIYYTLTPKCIGMMKG